MHFSPFGQSFFHAFSNQSGKEVSDGQSAKIRSGTLPEAKYGFGKLIDLTIRNFEFCVIEKTDTPHV